MTDQENKQVKELVDWVARELCFIDGLKWESIPDKTLTLFDGVVSKKQYKSRAKMIISHPDLALVACLQCPSCGIMIGEEEVRCQLSVKSQEEKK